MQALAQGGRRHLAVDEQDPPRLRRLPLEKAAAGRDRIGDAERNVRLAGAAHGIEHHQAFLRDDRIEHHAARFDVEREQRRQRERAQARVGVGDDVIHAGGLGIFEGWIAARVGAGILSASAVSLRRLRDG